MKGETVEVVEEPTHTVANTYFHWMKNNFHSLQTQTVVINGQQYQIVTPAATMEVAANNITTLQMPLYLHLFRGSLQQWLKAVHLQPQVFSTQLIVAFQVFVSFIQVENVLEFLRIPHEDVDQKSS